MKSACSGLCPSGAHVLSPCTNGRSRFLHLCLRMNTLVRAYVHDTISVSSRVAVTAVPSDYTTDMIQRLTSLQRPNNTRKYWQWTQFTAVSTNNRSNITTWNVAHESGLEKNVHLLWVQLHWEASWVVLYLKHLPLKKLSHKNNKNKSMNK